MTIGSPAFSKDKALQRLISGNERFLSGQSRPAVIHRELLAGLAKGQRPYATILGCSDSRVPPELIFDAGPGELFVIRVAGNVLSPEVAGSLQYAGAHLQTPLFVVLGHDGCGAVQAALDVKYRNARQRSRIQLLVESILPALPEHDARLSPEEQLSRAVEGNVRRTVRLILDSPEGQVRQAEQRMRLAGAIYEIATGRVRFLAPEASDKPISQ